MSSPERSGLSTYRLISMYRSMLRIRRFEERVAELLEARIVKTATHLYIGQEAVAVGVCEALRRDDLVWGNHRSHGHYLAKGGNMNALMAEILCKATGCAKGRGGSMHIFAGEVGILGTVPMVAATIPIAVGAALGSAIDGSKRVSVAFFGDGATEEGVFYEALNFAALRKLPVVFVCENNLYSSHLPLDARRPQGNLSLLAAPFGIPGVRVDGNDVVAVHEVASRAVERARAGAGPTLLECLTYRWRGHVGPKWDLDVGIREKAEVDAWVAKCPIKTLSRKLLEEGSATEDELVALEAGVRDEVEASVCFASSSPYPSPEDVSKYVFAEGGGQE